jgi:putative hemolysin
VFGREDLENLFLFGGVRDDDEDPDRNRETLRMAGRVLELVRRRVTEAMVPVPERRSCRETSTVGEAVERFRASSGRFLAVKDARGDVMGIVAAKQILGVAPEEPLSRYVRAAYPLRPEDTLDQAIGGLRRSRLSVAVVRDAAGRPLGVVTPEDLLEEIVGELPAAPAPGRTPEPQD